MMSRDGEVFIKLKVGLLADSNLEWDRLLEILN